MVLTIDVDNTAKAGGIGAALISWLSGAVSYALHPVDGGAVVPIVIAIIGGLCGIVGAGFPVLVRHWLDKRKKDKD